jgi:hypothetical protein
MVAGLGVLASGDYSLNDFNIVTAAGCFIYFLLKESKER